MEPAKWCNASPRFHWTENNRSTRSLEVEFGMPLLPEACPTSIGGAQCSAQYSRLVTFTHSKPYIIPFDNPQNHDYKLMPEEITLFERRYELRGLVMKTGASRQSGHFVTLIKELAEWYYYDDMIMAELQGAQGFYHPHLGQFHDSSRYHRMDDDICVLVLYMCSDPV